MTAEGDGLSLHQPGQAPGPAPKRCCGKTDISISPEEFLCPDPSQLGTGMGTGTGASAMHHSSLERGGGGGGYKPPSLLYPFLGPGAARGSESILGYSQCLCSL